MLLRRTEAEGGGRRPDRSREDGKPLKGCRERDFQAIVATLPKRQRVNLIVEWWVAGQPFRLRLIVIWNKKTQCFIYLLTNLPEERYDKYLSKSNLIF